MAPGDAIIVYSDGISGRFEASTYSRLAAPVMAHTILEACGKDHDDATCVVVTRLEP